MRQYKPGQAFYTEFTVHNEANNLVNADALPSVSAYKNGVVDAGFVLTAANISTGFYKITGTIPIGYADDDRVGIYVSCAVSGATKGGIVDQITIVSSDMSDLASGISVVGAYVDTEITTIINALTALQADLGDPSADATTIYAKIQEAIALIETTGHTGLRELTIQLYETATTTPIADATITVMNATDDLALAILVTNTLGQAVFAVDDGTYKLRIRKAGVTFTVPETMVVTADATDPNYGTPISTNPPSLGTCRVYDYLFQQDGVTPVPANKVHSWAMILEQPTGADATSFAGKVAGTYSVATGLIYWDIVYGAYVQFSIEAFTSINERHTIPALASVRISEIVEPA